MQDVQLGEAEVAGSMLPAGLIICAGKRIHALQNTSKITSSKAVKRNMPHAEVRHV